MPDHTDAFTALCIDIARRLARVCAHLPPAEFQQLVRDIAQSKLRHGAADSLLRELRLEQGFGSGTHEAVARRHA